MQNTNTTACTACTDSVLADGYEAVETITLQSFIDCRFCGRKDFWSGRTIVRPVDKAAGFQVGDVVLAHTVRQGRGLTGRPSTSTRRMEIGAVVEHEGNGIREAGTYYRLRRPGAKTQGGEVLWSAEDLTRA